MKDTSFATSLVGYHLRNIVRERGAIILRKNSFASFKPEDDLEEQAKKGFQEHIYFEFTLTVKYKSGNPMLSLRDLGDNVLIETFTESGGVSLREYRVSVPASQDIPLSMVNEETGMFSNYILPMLLNGTVLKEKTIPIILQYYVLILRINNKDMPEFCKKLLVKLLTQYNQINST